MEDYLKAVCEKYKAAVKEYEFALKQKEQWREELLRILPPYMVNGMFNKFNVKVNEVQPEPTIDWLAVQNHFKITQEQLKPFLKERKMQYRIAIQREIVTTEQLIKEIYG